MSKLIVKASGLTGDTERISETGGKSVESYERRMRASNVGIIVVALMALTILVMWLSDTWMAFEKSLGLHF